MSDEAVDRGKLDDSIAAAVRAAFVLQRADGSWQGLLPSSAVSTGSAAIALHAADPVRCAALIGRAVRWLRETQLPDGGWGDAPTEPGLAISASLNATAIAVAALQLVDPLASAASITSGLARMASFGGLDAVADKRRCTLKAICEHYLAAAGLYDGRPVARMPFELVLLPRRLRQKLSFTVPGLMAWGLMQAHTTRSGRVRRSLARLAEPKALSYLRDIHDYESGHPERPGGVEESALMASIVCYGLTRAGVGDDLARRYVDYLRATVRTDGSWAIDRDIEFSVSAYTTAALLAAGCGDDPRLIQLGQWIRACQRQAPFGPTGSPLGGWGWSIPSGWPDTDDTAGAVSALAGLGAQGGHDTHLDRGVGWLLAMQNRSGSYGCFTRNAGVSMDRPCTVMTAHALLGLQAAGLGADHRAVTRAIDWLRSVQRSDGAFGNVWFRGLTCGTGRVLDALGAFGLAGLPTARHAAQWLAQTQLDDGGWGDGEGSQSSAEETAWAVLGLVAAGQTATPAVAAGVRWLLRAQRPDGSWPHAVVGVYFLGLTYWCDGIADAYALQALSRFRSSLFAGVTTGAGALTQLPGPS